MAAKPAIDNAVLNIIRVASVRCAVPLILIDIISIEPNLDSSYRLHVGAGNKRRRGG
jgi:hypothetical protein